MNDTPKCSKCQTEMEVGYIMDRGHNNAKAPATWVEGEPVRSLWWGTKISGKEQLQVHTFRCPKCGYLESYAP
jgi:DNA-directed RNA polymerase subunit M/transcription elongation factor TFIIS